VFSTIHKAELSTRCSHEYSPQIARIYNRLTATFGSANPTTDEINRVLEAMELIALLCENDIAQKSYQPRHVVMQTLVPLA